MMIFSKHILLSALFLPGLCGHALYACNCEPVAGLSIADWNDAEVIFTATLLEHKMGMVGMLKFESRETFKGNADPIITFYFQPGKSHTLLHAVAEFRPGGEWVVFAGKSTKSGREYYRLKDSPVRTLCALSRPLQENRQSDPYLLFLQEMAQRPDGYHEAYDKDGRLIAEGAYLGLAPIDRWAYYDPERKMSVWGNYVDGQREGEWVQEKERPNDEKQLIRTTIYHRGAPVEICDYSHTGAVSLKKIFSDSTEVRHYYRYDGSLKSSIAENFESNTTHILSYAEDGTLQEERFLEGKAVVRQYWYNETGERVKEWFKEEPGH